MDLFETKIMNCGNTYYEKSTKGIFTDDVPANANIQSAVRSFCSGEKEAQFLKISLYDDMLLKQTRIIPELVMLAPRKRRRDQGSRGFAVATVVIQDPCESENFQRSTSSWQKQPYRSSPNSAKSAQWSDVEQCLACLVSD